MYKKVELPKEGYVGMEKEVAELWKERSQKIGRKKT